MTYRDNICPKHTDHILDRVNNTKISSARRGRIRLKKEGGVKGSEEKVSAKGAAEKGSV